MTAAWLLIAVIAGILLMAAIAIRASRVKAWHRPAAPSLNELIYAAGQRYRLDASQREAVGRAVRRGEAGPAGLREAVFDVATGLLAVSALQSTSRRRQGLLLAALGVLLAAWVAIVFIRRKYFLGLEASGV